MIFFKILFLENRYGTLDRYHHISDISKRAADDNRGHLSDYEKAPEITDIRDSSHYTVPNMAYNQSDTELCIGKDQGIRKIVTKEQADTSEKTLGRAADSDHYITIIS
jgi:hypothetical protein